MRIHVTLEFLDTLGVTPTVTRTANDFSNCLFHIFQLFNQPDQPPVWKHLLSNTCFDIADQPNTIQSNGAVVALGAEKLQELMTLPPQELVNTIQRILEDNARLSVSRICGHPFTPTAFEVVELKRLPSYNKILNTLYHQQAYHAIQHGWCDDNIVYAPTPSDRFNEALERSWADEHFDEITNFYVNGFVSITDNYELSGAFQMRFFLREMLKKLTTLAPTHLLDDIGDLTDECKHDIVKALVGHPKMPKYGIDIVRTELSNDNTADNPWKVLRTVRETYLEMQNLKKHLLMDPLPFWEQVRSHYNARSSQYDKDMLVNIVVKNYPYPKRPLTDRSIAILARSSYVLKQLFDAGVLTTDSTGGNFIDPDAKKYSAHSYYGKIALKDAMRQRIERNIDGEDELQAAQDLLNIFQRTTLSEHISGTHNATKRKI